MITKNKKGFLSLCVLLFVSLFLSIMVSNKRESYYGLLSVKTLDTKKQSATINLEEVVKNALKNGSNDSHILNQEVNKKIIEYLDTSEESWFIFDIKTNNKKEINTAELLKISKVLVIRPAPNIILKRYTFTNGLDKDKVLSFEIYSNCSKTTFSFPKNYSIEVIIYS